MTEQNEKIEKISMTNTKKDMLEAYNNLVNQLQKKKESELSPEARKEEKRNYERCR